MVQSNKSRERLNNCELHPKVQLVVIILVLIDIALCFVINCLTSTVSNVFVAISMIPVTIFATLIIAPQLKIWIKHSK